MARTLAGNLSPESQCPCQVSPRIAAHDCLADFLERGIRAGRPEVKRLSKKPNGQSERLEETLGAVRRTTVTIDRLSGGISHCRMLTGRTCIPGSGLVAEMRRLGLIAVPD